MFGREARVAEDGAVKVARRAVVLSGTVSVVEVLPVFFIKIDMSV